MNIAIIGLGLIGGSYAKATKSRTLHTVYGFDLDSEVMMFARMTGAIDKPLTDHTGHCRSDQPRCHLPLAPQGSTPPVVTGRQSSSLSTLPPKRLTTHFCSILLSTLAWNPVV